VLLVRANEANVLKTRLAIDERQHILTQTFPKGDFEGLARLSEDFLLPKSAPVQRLPSTAFALPVVVSDFVAAEFGAASGTGDLDRSLLPYQVEMDESKRLPPENSR
jgi:hypothetical protein